MTIPALLAATGLPLLALPLVGRAQRLPSPPALTASALRVGDPAPAFQAKDATGRVVDLSQMLKKGPVVLYFYRGQ